MMYLQAGLGIYLLLSALWVLREARRPGSLIRPTDWLTGDGGRLSGPKSFDFFAFVLTSWGFVVLFSTGHGDVLTLGTYATIWTTRSAVNKFQNQQQTAGTVSTTTATTTEIKSNVA